MLCERPFVGRGMGGIPGRCRRCPPCRISNRRKNTSRMLLEQKGHENSAFLTLTYNADNLPLFNSLFYPDVQAFLKKLRFYTQHLFKFRFFVGGEYGEKNERPHYHLVLFGFPTCSTASWLMPDSLRKACRCFSCEKIRSSWVRGRSGESLGDFYLGTATDDSIQYVAGYVSKAVIPRGDPGFRRFEFCEASNRGGIGLAFVPMIAEALIESPSLMRGGDVPSQIIINGRTWSLDSYMRKKIREEMGSTESGTPHESLSRYRKTLRDLRKSQGVSTIKEALLQVNEQRFLNVRAKEAIYKQRMDRL